MSKEQIKQELKKNHFLGQQEMIKNILLYQKLLKNEKLQAECEKINKKIKRCKAKRVIHPKTREKINEKINLLMRSNERAKMDNEKIQITRYLMVKLLAEEGIGTTFKTVKFLFDFRALEIAEHHEQCNISGIRFNCQYHGKNGALRRAIELLNEIV